MAPNSVDVAESVRNESKDAMDTMKEQRSGTYFRGKIRWQTTIVLATVHVIALYGLLTFPYLQSWKSLLWGEFIINFLSKFRCMF